MAVKYVYFHSIDRKTIFNSLMMSTVYFVHTQGQSLQSMKGSVLIDTPAIKSLGASYHIVFPGSSQDDSLFFQSGRGILTTRNSTVQAPLRSRFKAAPSLPPPIKEVHLQQEFCKIARSSSTVAYILFPRSMAGSD